jgi:hypothetical protein
MARDITWNSSSSITLTVPDNYATTSNQVTYAWDNTSGSSSFQYFYRKPGTDTSTAPKTLYIAKVTAFTFYRYDRLNTTTTTDPTTKRVQLSMTITSTGRTVVSATDSTISASFILRNKTSS